MSEGHSEHQQSGAIKQDDITAFKRLLLQREYGYRLQSDYTRVTLKNRVAIKTRVITLWSPLGPRRS